MSHIRRLHVARLLSISTMHHISVASMTAEIVGLLISYMRVVLVTFIHPKSSCILIGQLELGLEALALTAFGHGIHA